MRPAAPGKSAHVPPDRIGARIEAAARLLNTRQYAEAKQLYEDILDAAPDHPLALVGLAHLAILDNQAQRGFDILASTATVHRDHPAVLAGLAHAHEVLSRPDEALFCLERLVEIDASEPRHRTNLANLLLKLGRPAAALEQLEAALAVAPDHPGTHVRLGVLHIAVGDLTRAEDHLRRALAADPSLPEPKHNLANVLSMQGRHDAALEFAEAAYLQEPSRPEFQTAFIQALTDTGRLDQAHRLARRCMALAPHDLDLLEVAARLALMNGEGDDAYRGLAAHARRAPEDPEGLAALARSFAAAGRLTDALSFAAEALRVSPDHPNAAAIHRRLLFALGRLDEARGGAAAASPPAVYYAGGSDDPGEALLLSRFLRARVDAAPTLVCERNLGILLAHVDGLAVYESPVPPPDAQPLVSAAALLAVIGEGTPEPYLSAHPVNAAFWADALGRLPGPRIGLAWTARVETLGLSDIAKAMPPGSTPVSLMNGARRHDLRSYPDIVDAGVQIDGYPDLVAAIAGLDCVVACDGVVAHVAGALGKPGVVVVPENLPWCWAHADGRSLWYPSLQVLPVPIALQARPAAIERLAAICARYASVPALAAPSSAA